MVNGWGKFENFSLTFFFFFFECISPTEIYFGVVTRNTTQIRFKTFVGLSCEDNIFSVNDNRVVMDTIMIPRYMDTQMLNTF